MHDPHRQAAPARSPTWAAPAKTWPKDGVPYMFEKNFLHLPLPTTARQIKAALAARHWPRPGYRIHHVRPRSAELADVVGINYFAGAVAVHVSDHPGIEMLYFSDDPVARIYFYFGRDSFASTSVYLWAQLARDSSAVLDIGAYTGLYGLLAARAAPHATVIAFETDQHLVERLKENAELNGLHNLHHRGEAITNFDAPMSEPVETTFYDTPGSLPGTLMPSTLSVVPTAPEFAVSSIDQLDRDNNLPERIDLMRFDTDGAEYDGLDGARDRITRDRPVIFCEVRDEDALCQIAAFAGRKAYALFHVNEEARTLSNLLWDGDLDIPDNLGPKHSSGTVILSPNRTVSKSLLELAERFAQKPRVARPMQSNHI